MKNASLVYALLLALVFPSLLVGQGTKKRAKETTTREERPFTAYNFPLEPGATLSITVTFNAATENGTFFRDKSDPSGKQFEAWPGCGNFDQVNPKSFRYTNPGTATIPFEFSAAYKVTPPNPNQPWYPSYGKVISYSEKSIVIGYPNSRIPGGGGPSNCEVTITISAGKLPDPRE